jgi:hypothetical protein
MRLAGRPATMEEVVNSQFACLSIPVLFLTCFDTQSASPKRNGVFKGQATGETFNFQGKTDILIRVEGKNVFIAECKFWKGEKALLATLDQLLSYLSWRDTKAADRSRNDERLADRPCNDTDWKRRGRHPSKYEYQRRRVFPLRRHAL